MKAKTTKMGLQAARTLTGIPAARNSPQRTRVDAFGRVKPIGAYSVRCNHPEFNDPWHEPGRSEWCENCQEWIRS